MGARRCCSTQGSPGCRPPPAATDRSLRTAPPRRIVVRAGGVTMFGEPASVLVSAAWADDADTAPDLRACSCTSTRSDSARCNSGFDQFPVSVRLGDHRSGQHRPGARPGGARCRGLLRRRSVWSGTLAEFAVDGDGVSFAGAVTDGVLADASEVLGGGAVRLQGSLGASGVLDPDADVTVGLDLSASVVTNTPSTLADQGVTLDGTWTLDIDAEIGRGVQRASRAGWTSPWRCPIHVGGSLGASYEAGPPATTTFTLRRHRRRRRRSGRSAVARPVVVRGVGRRRWRRTARSTGRRDGRRRERRAGLGEMAISVSSFGRPDHHDAGPRRCRPGQRRRPPCGDRPDAGPRRRVDVGLDTLGLHVSTTTGTPLTKSSTVAVTGAATLFAGPGCRAAGHRRVPTPACLFRRASVGQTSTFLAAGQVRRTHAEQLSCDVPSTGRRRRWLSRWPSAD